MLSRNLGKSGISVSAIGLGCMGLSEFYGEPTQESEAINLLHRATDLGITHFDTAEIYGQGRNEQLLGKAFAGRWEQIVLATKFGPQRDPATGAFAGVDGSPTNVRDSCEKSLKRLGTERIAARKEVAAAQVALAWVLSRGDHVVAIPGTTKVANLQANLGALDCHLAEEDRTALNGLADHVPGDRYLPEEMGAVNQ